MRLPDRMLNLAHMTPILSPQEAGRGRSYTAAFSAMNARQPPNDEISRAPLISAGSTIKPFTPRPSASRIVPIDSGGGIAATNFPNAAADQAQSSSLIDDPFPRPTRSMPGFW